MIQRMSTANIALAHYMYIKNLLPLLPFTTNIENNLWKSSTVYVHKERITK